MHGDVNSILIMGRLGTDPKYKGADSAKLLGEVKGMLEKKGYGPVNVDANIIAEAPKMAPHIEGMRRRISDILGVPIGDVSVKARTAEGMGEIGEGRAIAVQAAVLVSK